MSLLERWLDRVLPDEGFYYVGSQIPNSTKYSQTPAESIQDAAGKINAIVHQHRNAYVAIGSYKDTSSRAVKNILWKKAFYMDLDCGPKKEFPSQKDAITQLWNFCNAAKLPKPNILVSSGAGIHAYWVLKESIVCDQWEDVARTLKAKTDELNFPADPVVTADAARILRPPETVNYKDATNPRVVKVIHEIPNDYDLTAITQPLSMHQDQYDEYFKGNNALAEGLDYANQQYFASYMTDNCPVMQEAKATGGKDYPEMLWSQQLNLLAFCEDGGQYIHAISDGYVGYSRSATERKFQSKQAAVLNQSTKPTLCKTFAQYKPEICAGCPHQSNIKTPLVLGRPPVQTGYPKGWSGANGWTYRTIEGEVTPMFPLVVDEVRLFQTLDNVSILSITHTIRGKVYTVEIPSYVLQSDGRQAAAVLATGGIDLGANNMKGFKELMMAWLNQIKKTGNIRPAVSQYGWAHDKNRIGFTSGNTLYWNDNAEEHVAVGDPTIRKIYNPKGTVGPWKKAAKAIVDTGSIELQIGLASAFAAPLVRFTQVKGVMLSLMSTESGTGKSTCLSVSQAVWGDPHAGINALNDTVNSVAKKLGMLNNLPAYWDELRMKKNVEDFIRLTFQIGQGKDKSRLNANSNMMETGTWNTLIVAATNEPLHDHLASMIQGTDAGAVRILEVEVPRITNEISVTDYTNTYRAVESNYGMAGAEYAKYLASHFEEVQKLVSKMTDNLASKINMQSAERFWVSTAATLLVGAHIAKKLGLVDFDLGGMAKCLAETINNTRDIAREETGTTADSMCDLIGEFLRQHDGGVIYAAEESPHRFSPNAVAVAPRQGVVARVSGEGDDAVVFIAKTPFRNWLLQSGRLPTPTIKQMRTELNMTSGLKRKIGVWGNKVTQPVNVYSIPMKEL